MLNGRIKIIISKETSKTHSISIRKSVSKRESTRKIPCTQYEYNTCQNLEENNFILKEYNCQIPALQYGQQLNDFIPNGTPICTDGVVKNAIELLTNKTTKCTRFPTCEMTRFTSMVKESAYTFVEDTDLVWISYSNPEVATYNTYVSYDLLTLIGEVGGILGLTLGVSTITFFELLLCHIPYC